MSSAGGELTPLQRLAVTVGPVLVRALRATWRIRVVNDAPWRALRDARMPFVFALWHGELLPLVVQHRGEGIGVLISEHRDGEVIARIARRLGLETIRGSTTRGAARALLGMVAALREGREIAVTPDGPRGPRHSYAPGAVVAAQRAGAPIVAIAVAASHAWQLRSWDRFTIPKPFARVAIAYGEPRFVAATGAREATDEAALFARDMEVAAAAAARALCIPAPGSEG